MIVEIILKCLKKLAYAFVLVIYVNNSYCTNILYNTKGIESKLSEKILEIKEKIIIKHKLDKMFSVNLEKNSKKLDICNGIFNKLKNLIFSKSDSLSKDLEKYRNSVTFSLENIAIINNYYHRKGGILATGDVIGCFYKNFPNFKNVYNGITGKYNDESITQIEIALLRLMFMEQLGKISISNIDDLKNYLEKVKTLYLIFSSYKYLYFNDVYNFIYCDLLCKFLNYINKADLIYYLDDFILCLNNFEIFDFTKNSTVNLFNKDVVDNFERSILYNSSSTALYFIKKLYEGIKKNGKIDTNIYNNIIKSIRNYVPDNEVSKIKDKVEISKEIFEYFYQKRFEYDGLYIMYNGSRISSIEFFTKKLDQIIVTDLEKNNETYNDIKNYCNFLEKYKDFFIKFYDALLVNYNKLIDEIKSLLNSNEGYLMEKVNKIQYMQKEIRVKSLGIKQSFPEIKLKNQDIISNFNKKFSAKIDIFTYIFKNYLDLEPKILEKLKNKLKGKVENLKKLNNSLYVHDQIDMSSKIDDLYFEKLQDVCKFNLKDSIEEIDLIEKDINDKLAKYKEIKAQLNVDFKSIMETLKRIKSININSDEIKIDTKYNENYFNNLSNKNIYEVKDKINDLKKKVNEKLEEEERKKKEEEERIKKEQEEKAKKENEERIKKEKEEAAKKEEEEKLRKEQELKEKKEREKKEKEDKEKQDIKKEEEKKKEEIKKENKKETGKGLKKEVENNDAKKEIKKEDVKKKDEKKEELKEGVYKKKVLVKEIKKEEPKQEENEEVEIKTKITKDDEARLKSETEKKKQEANKKKKNKKLEQDSTTTCTKGNTAKSTSQIIDKSKIKNDAKKGTGYGMKHLKKTEKTITQTDSNKGCSCKKDGGSCRKNRN